MEWGKIKTMFIYLFLILNIILFSLYIYIVNKNKTEIYKEQDAIIKSIKNDNIEILEPQQKKENISYISATVKKFEVSEIQLLEYNYELINDGETKYLAIKFEYPITNIKDNNYKEKLDKFIKEKLSKDLQYEYENYDENTKRIRYVQIVDNFKIYGNKNARIEFDVSSDGNIKSMTQTGLVNFKRDNVENIANYNQIIHKLYHENYITHNSRVSAYLGYYTSLSQIENQILIPSWKIEVFDGKKIKYYYVDAITMKILEKSNN